MSVVNGVPGESVRPPAFQTDQDFRRERPRLLTDGLASVARDLSRVSERFAELVEVNLQLASERNPQQLLDKMCHSARSLFGCRHAILAVGSRDGKETSYFTTSGLDSALASSIERPSLRKGILGSVFTTRRPARSVSSGSEPSSLGLPAGHPVVHTLLAAPIVSIGHTHGWICLTEHLGGEAFSDEDERLLGILGAQVGRIYENGSLYAELRESEQRFRQLADNIQQSIFLVDPLATRMFYVSPGYERIWGCSRESLYADARSWMDNVHPEDQDLLSASVQESAGKGSFDVSFRVVRPDGHVRWVRAQGFPIIDADGKLHRIAGIAEDVTESHLAQEKIRRLNRVHAVLSRINTAIVHLRNREQLLHEACRIAVEEGHFRMAWIGLLSQHGECVVPSAHAGHEAGYLEHVRLPMNSPDPIPISIEAMRSMRPAVRNHIADGPVSWKQEAQDRGYLSVAAFPLLVSGQASGVMCLYASEADYFDEREMSLLGELASDISFGMQFIDNEAKLEHQLYHDALTDLPNRASLHRRLGETIAARHGAQGPFALILLNINLFRDINDALGHQNGDALLRQVARRLQTTVRQSDLVACLGGDDFAVLLPHLAERADIGLVVEKVLHALQRTFVVAELPINVEVTLGIALYPEHGGDPDALWQHADVALRSAKARYLTHLYYEPSIDHHDPAQLALLGELRHAIEHDHLVLHYQPKLDLRRERTVGIEALVRWKHPERGMLFPDKFLPLVERTGLIDPLTIWVLSTAMRQVCSWRDRGLPLNLSVNLSARNLQNPQLTQVILDLARDARFPLNQLTVEITESAIMVDPVQAKQVLTALTAAGIGFSVDDFGIGQASLSYLKELPIQSMKIDKSFVMDYESGRNAAIVRSTIELGHNLGLSVTAEGVENETTFRALQELSCDQAQGYHFCKPLPPDAFIDWLRESRWKVAEATEP